MTWKQASSDAWWPSMTSSPPTIAGSSAAGQHVHLGNARQALRGLPIVCPGCHRCAEPGEAALRWPCIGGGMAAARQRGRDAFRGSCSYTSDAGEWSVLWHVPVEAHRVEGVKNFMLGIYESDVKSPQTLTYTYTTRHGLQ